MNSLFSALLVLTCASAQNISNVKRMRIEVDLSMDPSVRFQLAKNYSNSSAGNDSESQLSGRIINGAPATRGQFPWQVYIYMDSNYMCGGSIISSQWILTAAHCAATFKNFVIYMGKNDRYKSQDGQQTRITTRKVVNKNYNSALLTNDIALLKLDSITISTTVYPVQLPKKSDVSKTFAGQIALISGYGVTVNGTASNTLQYAQVNVISNSICQYYYGRYVATTNICTVGVSSRGTCQGDSGGPLVYLEGKNYTEIGIVSYGVVGCIGAPSAYTRVTSYLDWIAQNTGIVLRS